MASALRYNFFETEIPHDLFGGIAAESLKAIRRRAVNAFNNNNELVQSGDQWGKSAMVHHLFTGMQPRGVGMAVEWACWRDYVKHSGRQCLETS